MGKNVKIQTPKFSREMPEADFYIIYKDEDPELTACTIVGAQAADVTIEKAAFSNVLFKKGMFVNAHFERVNMVDVIFERAVIFPMSVCIKECCIE